MSIPNVSYVQRCMLSLTCMLVTTHVFHAQPRWFVLLPTVIVHVFALALICFSRTDA